MTPMGYNCIYISCPSLLFIRISAGCIFCWLGIWGGEVTSLETDFFLWGWFKLMLNQNPNSHVTGTGKQERAEVLAVACCVAGERYLHSRDREAV